MQHWNWWDVGKQVDKPEKTPASAKDMVHWVKMEKVENCPNMDSKTIETLFFNQNHDSCHRWMNSDYPNVSGYSGQPPVVKHGKGTLPLCKYDPPGNSTIHCHG